MRGEDGGAGGGLAVGTMVKEIMDQVPIRRVRRASIAEEVGIQHKKRRGVIKCCCLN